ncbi:MAG: serine/threonine protein kinase [Lentisphaeria bacterium]|nr:MAG: serine/threonine protein kinase [Lentisphaeria bacterium]
MPHGSTHPNIVQALDAGSSPKDTTSSQWSMSPGKRWKRSGFAVRGELTFRFLLDISIQLADALAYAWRHCQMIHGDIKPGNLLIRKGDRLLKLADLGLARISGAQGSDEIMVTPLYAAPEVIRGDFAQTGQTSDIYSFGVMFYELAAGRPPFRGDTDALIEAHLRLPPPPLAEVKPDVDPELAGFIMTMLEKDPEKRPGNWEEIGAFLRKNPHTPLQSRAYRPPSAAPGPENPRSHPFRPETLETAAAPCGVDGSCRCGHLPAGGGVSLCRLPFSHGRHHAAADHDHAATAGNTLFGRDRLPAGTAESGALRKGGTGTTGENFPAVGFRNTGSTAGAPSPCGSKRFARNTEKICFFGAGTVGIRASTTPDSAGPPPPSCGNNRNRVLPEESSARASPSMHCDDGCSNSIRCSTSLIPTTFPPNGSRPPGRSVPTPGCCCPVCHQRAAAPRTGTV